MASLSVDPYPLSTPPLDGTPSTLPQEVQEQYWNNLAQFYSQNQETIEKCISFDVKVIAKNGKTSESFLRVETFEETAKVILDGLATLANIHPVIGVAVFAFNGVITLDISRRNNDKKVHAIRLQMQNMMCAMFQLRNLKYAHAHASERERQKAQLSQLVQKIADEIVKCGSDINYYTDRKFMSKMINAKQYESRFGDHIKTFVLRRSELQTVITAYIAVGIDASNLATIGLATKFDAMNEKIDDLISDLFSKLNSPREIDILTFFDQNGGVKTCIAKDELLARFLSMAADSDPVDPTQTSTSERHLAKIKKDLDAQVKEGIDSALKQHRLRFKNLLAVQNKNFERLSDQIERQGHYLKEDSTKLDTLVSTSLLILENGRLIKKMIGSNSAAKLKDPELQRVWDRMGLKTSVKAKHFVLTFRDHHHSYLSLPSTPYTQKNVALPTESSLLGAELTVAISPDATSPIARLEADVDPDLWLLRYIDVAHVQPIVEAMDRDGSGFISVKEANEFALSRPQGFNLLQWIVYWAAGWHINITIYKKKISSILSQMYELLPFVRLANRACVEEYLYDHTIARVEALLRSTKDLPKNTVTESKLIDMATSIGQIQEQSLATNLKEVSFVISSQAGATLVAGSAPIESWIYPSLYLILNCHLAVLKLSTVHILHMDELRIHSDSLFFVFHVFDERMRSLEAIFSQANRKVNKQFETFAYGMFWTSYNKDIEIVPAKFSLVTSGNDRLSANSVLRIISAASSEKPHDSVLTNHTGKPFTYKPSDLSFVGSSSVDGHIPHPIEGYWSGVCLPVGNGNERIPERGLICGIFGPIQERQIQGHGDTFCGTVKFKGQIADTGNGYADVRFKIRWRTVYFCCQGRYDYAKDSIQGEWMVPDNDSEDDGDRNTESSTIDSDSDVDGDSETTVDSDSDANSDSDSEAHADDADSDVNSDSDSEAHANDADSKGPFDNNDTAPERSGNDNDSDGSTDDIDTYTRGSFHFTRTPAELFRFRHILATHEERYKSLSLARRRWTFAIEATRYQVQSHLHSSAFWCSRAEEKKKWIELGIRTDYYGRDLADAEVDEMLDLTWQIHPSQARIYESLSAYLAKRNYGFTGEYSCDSCDQDLLFRRFECIYCISEGLTNGLNFCVDDQCILSLSGDSESAFSKRHHISHTLLRSVRLIHKPEIATIIFQSRLRSERVKGAFRSPQTKTRNTKEDIAARPTKAKIETKSSRVGGQEGAKATIHTQGHPLACVYCKQSVSLPCWVCAECALDTIICLGCEQRLEHVPKEPVPKSNKLQPVTPVHPHSHLLLRIQDSVSYHSLGKKDNRLEQQLEGISSKLVLLEHEVQSLSKEVNNEERMTADHRGKTAIKVNIPKSITGYANDDALSTGGVSGIAPRISGIDTFEDHRPSLEANIDVQYEDSRNIAPSSNLDERMSRLEAKVDSQYDQIRSLLQQLVYSTFTPPS